MIHGLYPIVWTGRDRTFRSLRQLSLEAMSAPVPSRNSRVGSGQSARPSCRKAVFVARRAGDDLS